MAMAKHQKRCAPRLRLPLVDGPGLRPCPPQRRNFKPPRRSLSTTLPPPDLSPKRTPLRLPPLRLALPIPGEETPCAPFLLMVPEPMIRFSRIEILMSRVLRLRFGPRFRLNQTFAQDYKAHVYLDSCLLPTVVPTMEDSRSFAELCETCSS